MPDNKDFLSVNPSRRAKKEVRNIVNSYSHPWDVLAELCQNSVDAIRDWEEKYPDENRAHKIEIKVDQKSNSVTVKDTGLGISNENIPFLLAPNATGKDDNKKTIGEKGVGLTFCIFSANRFEIETRSEDGLVKGYVKNGRTWREKEEKTAIPSFEEAEREPTRIEAGNTGTKITLDDVRIETDGEDIFELSIERLKHTLRTKTAIGNTKKRFGIEEPEIDVELIFVDEDGNQMKNDVEYKYQFPDEFWPENKVVDIEEFENRDDIARMSDKQKRSRLGGKMWKMEGTKERNGKEIHYYAFFVQSRKDWDRVSLQHGLEDENGDGDLQEGIFIGTRGMPTGIQISRPGGGSAGYWANLFVFFEYDGFKFDLGRKSIPGPTQGMLKNETKEIFNKFESYKSYLQTSKSPAAKPPEVSQAQKKRKFKELNRLNDLSFEEISYEKQPNKQEAGVVAIFHELVGSGHLENYKCYRAGYSQDYDFWGEYEATEREIGSKIAEQLENDVVEREIVLEFKYKASSIIPDINDGRKYLEDIDLLVVWNMDQEGFEQTSVDISEVNSEERFYKGNNYQVIPANSDGPLGEKLSVISLKELIEEIK